MSIWYWISSSITCIHMKILFSLAVTTLYAVPSGTIPYYDLLEIPIQCEGILICISFIIESRANIILYYFWDSVRPSASAKHKLALLSQFLSHRSAIEMQCYDMQKLAIMSLSLMLIESIHGQLGTPYCNSFHQNISANDKKPEIFVAMKKRKFSLIRSGRLQDPIAVEEYV